METPKKTLDLKIGPNTYTIKFPDTGTLIDLEQAKARINMPSTGTDSGLVAYNLAIAIETFRMLIPQLQEDLNVKGFDKMDVLESKSILKAYLTQFRPWFNDWIKVIIDVFEDSENV